MGRGAAELKPMPEEAAELLSEDLCWLLSRATHSLLTELTAGLEEIGVSPRAHQILMAARTGPYTQIELARTIGLDKTTMVVTLDELERAGLAERQPAPSDRRARVIAVTPAGQRKLRKADEILAGIREDVLSALPADEREVFMRALSRLVSERLAEPVATAQPVRRRVPRS
jgi:DNA-binding MarR family transcriptional regulator